MNRNGIRRRTLLISFLAALFLAQPGFAAGGWQVLGTRVVNDSAEFDTIVVGRDEGRFTRLRLVVDDAPIQIHRVEVHYANGKTQVFPRDVLIRENAVSPPLDLQGGRRAISKVVFRYQARSRGFERATVKLLGHR